MHSSEIAKIAEQAKAKANYLDRVPGGYLVLSALAGVYLGFGVTLIFSVELLFCRRRCGAQAGDGCRIRNRPYTGYFCGLYWLASIGMSSNVVLRFSPGSPAADKDRMAELVR
jgi:hypothetical protein